MTWLDAQKVADVVNSVMADLLGKKMWQALKHYIAEEHDFDASKPDEIVEAPESFEKILAEMLGPGAALILNELNRRLIETFSIKEPEKFAYSQLGDYGKLIEALKNMAAGKDGYTKKQNKDGGDNYEPA